ncbi:MAG: flippase-like domain-containing protein [Solirubrobacteraceae bacterium]|nr:flippase-like domain-containing protein [Solirubrobacteraceae bacterium]
MSSAPVDVPNLEPEDADEGEMPRARIERRQAVIFGVFVVAVVAFLYFGLPQLAGFDDTLERVRDGDPLFLLLCLVFELISFGGYVWLFRAVYVRGSERIDWRASYEITMAGLAATRLFAAAGAGGAALTAWALRQSGMRARVVATRMVAQYVLLYAVYMILMIISGLGLYYGLFSGEGDFAITMIPGFFGIFVLAAALSFTFIPDTIDRRLERWAQGSGRFAMLVAKASKLPAAVGEGVREALRLIRDKEWGVLGALIWWLFDILTLWAAFWAFGEPPPFFALIMAYYVGMLANLLPLPGGIGGVDGGMIGALIAFGVAPSLAIVSVLTYRAFAFWLPTVPGFIAYLQLRKTVAGWREERALQRTGEAPALGATIQSEVTLPTAASPQTQRTSSP